MRVSTTTARIPGAQTLDSNARARALRGVDTGGGKLSLGNLIRQSVCEVHMCVRFGTGCKLVTPNPQRGTS